MFPLKGEHVGGHLPARNDSLGKLLGIEAHRCLSLLREQFKSLDESLRIDDINFPVLSLYNLWAFPYRRETDCGSNRKGDYKEGLGEKTRGLPKTFSLLNFLFSYEKKVDNKIKIFL